MFVKGIGSAVTRWYDDTAAFASAAAAADDDDAGGGGYFCTCSHSFFNAFELKKKTQPTLPHISLLQVP